jgi:hypothetical protein
MGAIFLLSCFSLAVVISGTIPPLPPVKLPGAIEKILVGILLVWLFQPKVS